MVYEINQTEFDMSTLRRKIVRDLCILPVSLLRFNNLFDGILPIFFFNFQSGTVNSSINEYSLKMSLPCSK